MTHPESNGHVTDDVTWPWKVKVVTPICLVPIRGADQLSSHIQLSALFVINVFFLSILCMDWWRNKWTQNFGRNRGGVDNLIWISSYSIISMFQCIYVVYPWGREKKPRLINHEITFNVFQLMWPRYLNVTDRRTDKLPWQYRALLIA